MNGFLAILMHTASQACGKLTSGPRLQVPVAMFAGGDTRKHHDC